MIRAWLLVVVLAGTLEAETIPPRADGELDIHHINTGLGDQTLFVLPDGTTLLVDTGDIDSFLSERGQDIPFSLLPRPDASRTAGTWVARYIERVAPEKKLNYLLLTHFHPDHMDGLGDVTSKIEVDLVIDRGWPDYGGPVPVPAEVLSKYRQMTDGLTVARFHPGRSDQIVLRHDRASYPTFEVKNLTANGEYWTGKGDETQTRVPPLSELPEDDYPTENMSSLSFLMRYGAFGYFTGGDLPGVPVVGQPEWHDVESAIAESVGPVDVHAVNHHGGAGAAGLEFLAALKPRVHVLSAYTPWEASPTVIKRLLSERVYDGARDVFVLQYRDSAKAAFNLSPPRLQSESGHVVVRVEAGGATYRVFVVTDADESGTILSTHGPYRARSRE